MAIPPRYGVGELFRWQAEALKAWSWNGCRGIVEAVTGAGKTRLALAAAAQTLNDEGKVAVIVPTVELQRQWHKEILRHLPGAEVGLLGGGQDDSLGDHDLLVAVANSASKYELGLEDLRGLLIADECHRLATETFQRALEDPFTRRLGLSATHERPDGAHERILLPYFKKVVYSLGYREAIRDGCVARMKVAEAAIQLTGRELSSYAELSERIRELQSKLEYELDMDSEPFAEFMGEVKELAESGDWGGRLLAQEFLSKIWTRKKLLAEAQAKRQALSHLHAAMAQASRTLVFTSAIESAEEAERGLRELGLPTEALHSQLSSSERKARLQRFEQGRTRALVAPNVLDEGIDVPEADLAVILAGSRTRRQMIQRMGRVLRPKHDGRAARFVLVFAAGTVEDPGLGAHETFFNELLDVASERRRFSLPIGARALGEYLDPRG